MNTDNDSRSRRPGREPDSYFHFQMDIDSSSKRYGTGTAQRTEKRRSTDKTAPKSGAERSAGRETARTGTVRSAGRETARKGTERSAGRETARTGTGRSTGREAERTGTVRSAGRETARTGTGRSNVSQKVRTGTVRSTGREAAKTGAVQNHGRADAEARRTAARRRGSQSGAAKQPVNRLTAFLTAQIPKSGIKGMTHLILFPVVFVYFELILRIYGGNGVFKNLIYPVLFGIAFGLFCSCITSVFSRKINRVISMVLLYGIGLLFIIECLIKDSYQVYMTFGAIMTGAGGVMGGFASELFGAILHGIPVILLFLLPGILYTAFGKKRLPARRYRLSFVLLLLICSFFMTGISVFAATHGGSKEKYKSQFEFNTATQSFGLITSMRLSGKYSLFGNENASALIVENEAALEANGDAAASDTDTAESEMIDLGDNVMDLNLETRIAQDTDETIKSMDTYVNSQIPSNKNKYTGLFEGKNLILICAEAFSDSVISKELTPTLYRLVHNGIYFSNYYQPTWGGSTSTGEYSFLTGLVPLDGVETMQETQGKNLYFTMGSQLERLNYFSRCYHNGEYDFYSRQLTHENFGYEQFLGLGNGLEDITGWWPTDGVMFDKTMDTYMNQQPFSIYYMTISGHCTYKADDSRVTNNLKTVLDLTGGKYKDTTNYYLSYQMELEYGLRTMIEKLEAAGIADDTVICLTSDHYPYGLENTSTFGNSDDYVTDLYGYKYTNSWEQDHNTWILWSGCLENENKDMACEISEPTYSLDIVPTLSNLFGLTYDSRLLVGRDVFSDTEPLVLWNNYSWMTDKGRYNSATGVFEPETGVTVDDAYVERIKTIVSNKITFSDQILKKDYYNVLFGSSD